MLFLCRFDADIFFWLLDCRKKVFPLNNVNRWQIRCLLSRSVYIRQPPFTDALSLTGQFCCLEKGRVCFFFGLDRFYCILQILNMPRNIQTKISPLRTFLHLKISEIRLPPQYSYQLYSCKTERERTSPGIQIINTILQDHFELLVGIS